MFLFIVFPLMILFSSYALCVCYVELQRIMFLFLVFRFMFLFLSYVFVEL